MTEKLDGKELVSFEQLLMVNVIQTDAVTQLLIEKGLITEEEFFTKLYCLPFNQSKPMLRPT